MQYVRFCTGLHSYKLVPETENIYDLIGTNLDKDHYVSIFKYNDDHYKHWVETKSVSGLSGVVTNRLYFDFDSKLNIEMARQDALELIKRLAANNLDPNKIEIAFTGHKGFSVEVLTDVSMTQEEFKNITFGLASDLSTFDKVVNDSQRITRITGTKHNKSGLYKLPMSLEQLTSLSVEEIKNAASDFTNVEKAFDSIVAQYDVVSLPEKISKMKVKPEAQVQKEVAIVHDLDLRLKPKWMSDAKYALQEGYFGSGERNLALMILGATYKTQGFNKATTYRMLKGVAETQSERNGVERFPDKEIWTNIVSVIYSETWQGGNYSYNNTPLLQDITKRLGLKAPKEGSGIFLPMEELSDNFRKFAIEIDKNTIKLGIEELDKDVRITTSMLVNLLAAPSAGKSSVSFNVLNHASRNNVNSIFFSLDMGSPLVYQRLVQKHFGLNSKQIFEIFKNGDKKRVEEIQAKIFAEYKNVNFSFKSGVTPQDIDQSIEEHQEKTGQKVKLVVVDYLECLSTGMSDATASTGYAAQLLKDIANKHEVTVLLLVQPQKHAGDPSSELLSMRNIKGSGQIEQAASVILTMWRPGFGPKYVNDDKYLSMAVVKNRMGSLGKYDFSWDGLRGTIGSLSEEQRLDLAELIEKRALEKAAKEGGGLL